MSFKVATDRTLGKVLKSGFKCKVREDGKGERLIIVHVGTALGWVQCAKWFKSKTKSADYHDEMNAQHFLEWFETQLVPNIPPHSLIILYNAKYHNTVVEKYQLRAVGKKI